MGLFFNKQFSVICRSEVLCCRNKTQHQNCLCSH